MEHEIIEKLRSIILNSQQIVFFGGAGVSTESGIPDFRSKEGLYNQHDIQFEKYEPEYLLSRECLYHNPKVFYEFYRQKLDARNVLPNDAHKKLAELEQMGKLKAVITQNIDGLHQKAGSKVVYELHGTTLRNICVKCKTEYDGDFIFNSKDSIPTCPKCGRPVRPDVTLYGENLPEDAWNGAMIEISKADTLIIAGTSLSVYPAATLIDYFTGDNLIIINHDTTDRDKWADLVIHDSIGKVLAAAIN